ncbi:MAG: hypothetical protein C0621_04950 [Desulfuromonas sp.]|nr:MAG: hypothetical protein C0621_04950 [Desulfuromonas sp.]
MEKKVEAARDSVGPCAGAETVGIGDTIDADDQGRFTFGLIGAVSLSFEETIVKDTDRMNVAGMYPDNDSRWGRGLCFEVDLAAEAKAKELLPVGEKILFKGVDLWGEIEDQFRRIIHRCQGEASSLLLVHSDHVESAAQGADELINLFAADRSPAFDEVIAGVCETWECHRLDLAKSEGLMRQY